MGTSRRCGGIPERRGDGTRHGANVFKEWEGSWSRFRYCCSFITFLFWGVGVEGGGEVMKMNVYLWMNGKRDSGDRYVVFSP